MPILKTKILGSTIEINYQKNEKEKLDNLIETFKQRLLEFENLKDKFAENKIIFLAALKAEDKIVELSEKLYLDEKISQNSKKQQEKINDKIKEIILLKDQISILEENNQKLNDHNKINMNEINKINKRLLSLIDKILYKNNDSS